MFKPKALIANINRIIVASLVVFFASIIATPAIVNAQGAAPPPGGTTSATKDDVCAGLELATGQGCDAPAAGESSVETVIATVVNVLSWIVGVAAVIVLIISGFRFVVSSGDTQAVSNAKNGIIYAVIGLLVVLFAQVIVQFVVDLA